MRTPARKFSKIERTAGERDAADARGSEERADPHAELRKRVDHGRNDHDDAHDAPERACAPSIAALAGLRAGPRWPSDRGGCRRLLIGLTVALAAAGALAACGEDRTPAVTERSVPWQLQSIDERRLRLSYEAGACAGVAFSVHPRVDEGSQRVTIAVIARRPRVSTCAGKVVLGRVAVTLQAPLGDRSLIHAPVSRDPEAPRAPTHCPTDAGDAPRLDARRLIGLAVSAARALASRFGCTIRVIERDGRPLPHTQEVRSNRINFDVRDARVLRVSVG